MSAAVAVWRIGPVVHAAVSAADLAAPWLAAENVAVAVSPTGPVVHAAVVSVVAAADSWFAAPCVAAVSAAVAAGCAVEALAVVPVSVG